MLTWNWIIGVWLFLLGACVGSLLNVVVARLPRGKSILRPGSRCPVCEKPIRPWHNIPLIGWLLLRGRCYDCGSPIRGRYPLVELIAASWFVVVAWVTLNVQGHLTSTDPGLLWIFAGNLALLGCGVFCGLLILQDQNKIPRALIVLVLLSVLIAGGLLWVLVTG